MSVPNRLQVHWKQMKPRLLAHWPKLTPSDLDYTEGEFDRLVSLVKQRYDDPIISVKEADIRAEVLKMLSAMET